MLVVPMMDITSISIGDCNEVRRKDYIYVYNDNKLLKLYVTINANVLKENFIKFYYIMKKELTDFEIVSEKGLKTYSFPISMPYVGKQTAYEIPGKEDGQILRHISNIYEYNHMNMMNRDLNLDEFNIEELFIELCEPCSTDRLSAVKREVIMNIVSNLDIELVETYDYDELCSSVRIIESITRNSIVFNSKIYLSKLKGVLNSAKEYSKMMDKLGIALPGKKTDIKVKKFSK